MKRTILGMDELSSLATYLHSAAIRYRELSESLKDGSPRAAEQFARQAEEADKFASLFFSCTAEVEINELPVSPRPQTTGVIKKEKT
jgi:phosphoenolpyruvate carboxylase